MLRPLRIEVDCVYACPSCGCETWYTVLELKHRRFLECLCGKRTQIEQVSHVEVAYSSDNTEKFDKTGHNPVKNENMEIVNDFVSTLVGLGYKKSVARQIVVANQEQYDGDEGKFVSFLLQQLATT